jgi:hypothetical protein
MTQTPSLCFASPLLLRRPLPAPMLHRRPLPGCRLVLVEDDARGGHDELERQRAILPTSGAGGRAARATSLLRVAVSLGFPCSTGADPPVRFSELGGAAGWLHTGRWWRARGEAELLPWRRGHPHPLRCALLSSSSAATATDRGGHDKQQQAEGEGRQSMAAGPSGRCGWRAEQGTAGAGGAGHGGRGQSTATGRSIDGGSHGSPAEEAGEGLANGRTLLHGYRACRR